MTHSSRDSVIHFLRYLCSRDLIELLIMFSRYECRFGELCNFLFFVSRSDPSKRKKTNHNQNPNHNQSQSLRSKFRASKLYNNARSRNSISLQLTPNSRPRLNLGHLVSKWRSLWLWKGRVGWGTRLKQRVWENFLVVRYWINFFILNFFFPVK